MAIFGIADLHLSLGTNKPMDVFSGWENYTQRLKENWLKLVSDDDTVVIAGDISWAMRIEETIKDFTFIEELPGQKLFLKGNHDYWWGTKNKTNKFLEENGFNSIKIIHNSAVAVGDYAICGTRGWMYNSYSDEDMKIVRREAGRLKMSIEEAEKLGKKPIAFLHYPPVYDQAVCEDIINVLKEHNITDCYFGHIHGRNASTKLVLGDFRGINMKLISCDYLKFAPLFISK